MPFFAAMPDFHTLISPLAFEPFHLFIFAIAAASIAADHISAP